MVLGTFSNLKTKVELTLFFLISARRWPIIFGGGIGFGLAYKNCEQELNTSLSKVISDLITEYNTLPQTQFCRSFK